MGNLDKAIREMRSAGYIDRQVVDAIEACVRTGDTSLLVSLPDQELYYVLKEAASSYRLESLLSCLLEYAPDKVAPFVEDLLDHADVLRKQGICRVLLEKQGPVYEPLVVNLFRSLRNPGVQFCIGMHLARYDHAKYAPEVLPIARLALRGSSVSLAAAQWMIENYRLEALPDIRQMIDDRLTPYQRGALLSFAVERLGACAVDLVLSAMYGCDFSNPALAQTRFEALEHLAAIDDGTHRPDIIQEIVLCIEHYAKDPQMLVKYVNLASRWDPAAVDYSLWQLVTHKSKPVRESAARALGKLGEAALPKAGKLLVDRKAETRMAATIILTSVNSPRAQKLLEAQIDVEENDDVREAMLQGLQDAWAAQGRNLGREDVERWIEKGVSRMKWPPTYWIPAVDIPTINYQDGTPLAEDAVRYLISRQSRCAEIKSPVELKPLYEIIDRRSSGDLALSILNGWLANGADAKGKWALALAGLLGDDRIVPALDAQIKQWVDTNRGKLAEYAVQALALLATDRALLLVDSLAMRYRTRMKNIGAAAVEAFGAVADSLGITPEELGDRVVPWMGFESGRPRIIDCGGKSIELRVGTDFKLQYTDLEKNKKISSLPSSAPADIKAELKELSTLLRDVAKAQNLRLENLMVRQYRWPAPRWKDLFLAHPIMKPFGIRLIWGIYDANGQLTGTFRALEDSSLTDTADESVALDDAALAGIVHPLEMDEEMRNAWLSHLSDYEIIPPFPQLERPVVICEPEQADMMFYKEINGTNINGMTFRGRAERLGWRRGSVCDGGTITTYWKSFPSAGVDAFIGVEDMFVGMDMYSSISLTDAYFVQTGSVKIGNYEYDEPGDEKDPRLIPFGKVPPIVFSEVMGDLGRMVDGG